MEFGFEALLTGPLTGPDDLATVARHGEALGFEALSVSDHIVVPRNIRSRYPYSDSGDVSFGGDFLEQLTALCFLAGQISNLRLLTSVMVVPYRPPIHTAKMLATIDVLSKGRLIVGCGVGWMQEEFELLKLPPFQDRGDVTDEYIRAFKELWTQENPSFHGKRAQFSDMFFEPKPVQKPHPPIWIGGESAPALRRAARLGDGWYPTAMDHRRSITKGGGMAELVAQLRRYAEEAGRDPSSIEIACLAGLYDDRQARTSSDGERISFTGTHEEIASDIRNLRAEGVQHVFFFFPRDTLSAALGAMERFASRVRPLAEA